MAVIQWAVRAPLLHCKLEILITKMQHLLVSNHAFYWSLIFNPIISIVHENLFEVCCEFKVWKQQFIEFTYMINDQDSVRTACLALLRPERPRFRGSVWLVFRCFSLPSAEAEACSVLLKQALVCLISLEQVGVRQCSVIWISAQLFIFGFRSLSCYGA